MHMLFISQYNIQITCLLQSYNIYTIAKSNFIVKLNIEEFNKKKLILASENLS